jgi:N-acetylglucosamine-6-phosphate deacetylase
VGVALAHRRARLAKGFAADIVALSDGLEVMGVWIAGKRVAGG